MPNLSESRYYIPLRQFLNQKAKQQEKERKNLKKSNIKSPHERIYREKHLMPNLHWRIHFRKPGT